MPKFDAPDLIIGPEGGSDAGVYRLRDDLLIVQSLDFFPPLVDDPYVYGQIAAANALSDVFAMGGRPLIALNIVGFPDDQLDLEILEKIQCGGAERVRLAGAVIAGGHTVRDAEIKYGLSVTGVVEPERLLTNRDARPGDALVLTKALGTGFVTTAFKADRCADSTLVAATQSMIQLNSTARDVAHAVGAHASTDVSGFGLIGHAAEMALSSEVTLSINLGSLPLLPGAAELARQGYKTRASATNRDFVEPIMRIEGKVDPTLLEFLFDAQTSGGLLISVPEDRAREAARLAVEGGAEAAAVIGHVEERQDVALVIRA